MICLGNPQTSPSALESEAAQLRVIQLFRADFTRRYPDGIVISELEYMGRTTAAPNQPGPIQFSGRPRLNQIMSALSADFRRWVRERDYRKCDALGIARDGTYAELVEVTTGDNVLSAATQITAKLAILTQTVNRIHNLSVDWRPSLWRPSPNELFYPLPPRTISELRYLCYTPTFRVPAPPGVVLYEVHIITRPVVPVPVQIPAEAAERLREAVRSHPPREATAEEWARQFLRDNPAVGIILRALAIVVGVALVIAAIILIFDPVPGDEAAAGAAAAWLLRLATSS